MNGPLVLVVEDSRTQALQIAANLTQHGMRAIIAGDGPDGLRAVDEHAPDFVVVKVNLPTMSGYQMCRRLKRDPNTAHLPVIIMGLASAEHAEQSRSAGEDGYIPKDVFTTERLMDALRAFGLVV